MRWRAKTLLCFWSSFFFFLSLFKVFSHDYVILDCSCNYSYNNMYQRVAHVEMYVKHLQPANSHNYIYICVFATLRFVLINSVPLKLLCVNLDFV